MTKSRVDPVAIILANVWVAATLIAIESPWRVLMMMTLVYLGFAIKDILDVVR